MPSFWIRLALSAGRIENKLLCPLERPDCCTRINCAVPFTGARKIDRVPWACLVLSLLHDRSTHHSTDRCIALDAERPQRRCPCPRPPS